MPFANFVKNSAKGTSNFKRTEFLKLTPGKHTIRILDNEAVVVPTHYLVTKTGKYTIKCLGDDCPICHNNRVIYSENPEDFRKIPGYFPKSQRGFTNVLDRTVAKTCPSCGQIIKKVGTSFPSMCSECQTILVEVKERPLNKVCVLSMGITLGNNISAIESTILDENEEKVGINNYNLVLIKEAGSAPSAIPAVTGNDKVEVNPDDLFDLDKAIITLAPDEILSLLKGVSLRDIFLGRNSDTTQEDTVKEEDVDSEELAEAGETEIQSQISELFS